MDAQIIPRCLPLDLIFGQLIPLLYLPFALADLDSFALLITIVLLRLFRVIQLWRGKCCALFTSLEAPLVDLYMLNAKAPSQASDVLRGPVLFELVFVL